MKKIKVIVLLMVFLVSLYFDINSVNAGEINTPKRKGRIEVEVVGLESSKGVVHFCLHDSKTFTKINLKKERNAECFYQDSKVINDGNCRWISDPIPYNDYAILVHHDENNNEEMDRKCLVIPIEKSGVSNYNEKLSSYLEEKDFKKAKIELNSEKSPLIKIKMFYPGRGIFSK